MSLSPPRSSSATLVLALAAFTGLGACSRSGEAPAATPKQDAGQDAGSDGPRIDAQAAAPDAPSSTTPDTQGTLGTACVDIRNCILQCADEAACQRCVDDAPAAARMTYQALTTCSQEACAADDRVCRCDRECFEPGACVPLVEDCRGDGADRYCDELCH